MVTDRSQRLPHLHLIQIVKLHSLAAPWERLGDSPSSDRRLLALDHFSHSIGFGV